MATFSEKYGYVRTEKLFQREILNQDLRVAIWNVLKVAIWDRYDFENANYCETSKKISFLTQKIWIHLFNRDLDKLPRYTRYETGVYLELKNYFFEASWFRAYDFLEYIVKNSQKLFLEDEIQWINQTLEKFNSAYRIVNDSIVEVTDENEIESIKKALDNPHQPVRDHLKAALEKLSNKEKPDYRNSIKESISAVEALCRILTGKKSATLGDALKKIDDLHPVLGQAFGKLYGYTCDASGVRHSLMDESNITYADAKFMLVTCSAFVSYLNTTAAK